MTKLFYRFAIFLLLLSVLQDILLNYNLHVAGKLIFFRYFLLPFFLVQSATHILGGIVLLLYLNYRKYWLPFSAGWLCIVFGSAHAVIMFEILGFGNFQDWYSASLGSVYFVNILLGVSFLVSKACERKWLKWNGIVLVVVVSVQMGVLAWSMMSHDVQEKDMLAQLSIWMNWGLIVGAVFLVMNFQDELKRTESWTNTSRFSVVAIVSTGLLLSALTALFGTVLHIENGTPPPRTAVVSQKTMD